MMANLKPKIVVAVLQKLRKLFMRRGKNPLYILLRRKKRLDLVKRVTHRKNYKKVVYIYAIIFQKCAFLSRVKVVFKVFIKAALLHNAYIFQNVWLLTMGPAPNGKTREIIQN